MRAFARGNSDPAGIQVDASFQDLGIDSLDFAEIAAELELEFNMMIDDAAFRGVGTVRAVADHLTAVIAAKQH